MKPCMKIAAREIHEGTICCNLSAKTAIVRYHREDNFSEKMDDNFSEYGVTSGLDLGGQGPHQRGPPTMFMCLAICAACSCHLVMFLVVS